MTLDSHLPVPESLSPSRFSSLSSVKTELLSVKKEPLSVETELLSVKTEPLSVG